MTKRVVVSALCCALWVLMTGCGDECSDAFDCRADKGQPAEGQEWTCNANNECEQRPVTQPPEQDAGTDAGTGDVDAGTDAGTGMDAGTDAGMDMDAGTDAGSMSVPKGGACISSGDCQAGLRCEGTPSLCQAMHVAVTATTDGGTFKALVMRYDTPGMFELSEEDTSRYPRWGPEGNRVAFARGANESEAERAAGELVVRDLTLATGQDTVLADGGTGNTQSFRYMEWEPGNSILYTRRNDGGTSGISAVPTDGGAVITATQTGTFPEWSSDGRTFAFSTAGTGLSISEVGGTATPIVTSGSTVEQATAEQPYFNRVNNQLLFLRPDEARPAGFNTSLFLVPVTGGTVQPIAAYSTEPVTGGSIDSYIANPTWAPDGSWVAYVRAYFSNADPLVPGDPRPAPVLCGNVEATLCPTRPGNVIFVRRIGTPAAAEASFVESGTLPSFSPDSRFLAYVKGGQLYVQQLDPATGLAASGVDPIVHPRGGYTVQTGAGDDHRPRWQPR